MRKRYAYQVQARQRRAKFDKVRLEIKLSWDRTVSQNIVKHGCSSATMQGIPRQQNKTR